MFTFGRSSEAQIKTINFNLTVDNIFLFNMLLPSTNYTIVFCVVYELIVDMLDLSFKTIEMMEHVKQFSAAKAAQEMLMSVCM